jgi:hypothetical protein
MGSVVSDLVVVFLDAAERKCDGSVPNPGYGCVFLWPFYEQNVV